MGRTAESSCDGLLDRWAHEEEKESRLKWSNGRWQKESRLYQGMAESGGRGESPSCNPKHSAKMQTRSMDELDDVEEPIGWSRQEGGRKEEGIG